MHLYTVHPEVILLVWVIQVVCTGVLQVKVKYFRTIRMMLGDKQLQEILKAMLHSHKVSLQKAQLRFLNTNSYLLIDSVINSCKGAVVVWFHCKELSTWWILIKTVLWTNMSSLMRSRVMVLILTKLILRVYSELLTRMEIMRFHTKNLLKQFKAHWVSTESKSLSEFSSRLMSIKLVKLDITR